MVTFVAVQMVTVVTLTTTSVLMMMSVLGVLSVEQPIAKTHLAPSSVAAPVVTPLTLLFLSVFRCVNKSSSVNSISSFFCHTILSLIKLLQYQFCEIEALRSFENMHSPVLPLSTKTGI